MDNLHMINHPARRAGPAWHGIVDHPQHGIVRLVAAEDAGIHPPHDIPTGWYKDLGPISDKEAFDLLRAALWDDELEDTAHTINILKGETT